jgi:Zn-dependent peptidase ImmA (M78 family)
MTIRIEGQGELIRWARKRARADIESLATRFPKIAEWERGDTAPTLKQLEDFANATHAPIGFLLLPEPPVEELPLPDFRTIGDLEVARPSPDLMDTIFQCEQRQEWYRDYLLLNGEPPLDFVGSLTTADDIIEAGGSIRAKLNFEVDSRGASWSDGLRRLIEHAEDIGVLVMINGVVGNNTHRKLDPKEFRGFAIADSVAPLVFVNGADTKAAQIFTLVHELVHVWLGQSAVTDVEIGRPKGNETEQWCNRVAAEVLVPIDAIRQAYREQANLTEELQRLARTFKVSTLVVLRRLRDAGYMGEGQYWDAFHVELQRVLDLMADGGGSGGNFYNTQPLRVSRRFVRAVITSAGEGQTSYRDAFRMLGIKKTSTFQELSSQLGIS